MRRPDRPQRESRRLTVCSPRSSATARAADTRCPAASARWCRSRALALGPKLLLLDEPTEGLSPVIVPSIIQGLASIRAFGHALFIAESNIHHVPDFADRLDVIDRGEFIFTGKPEAAAKDAVVARIVGGVSTPAGGGVD